MTRPTPRDGILAIDAYVPGKSAAPGAQRVFKLSANETPLGPSPHAIEAARAAIFDMANYPDGGAVKLREAIAATHGLDPARVICGAGSDNILELLAIAYVGPGDEGIYSEYGFLEYKIVIRAAGGLPVIAAETDYAASVDAILACVTAKTKIVFIANPNNPTGSYLPHREMLRLREKLPEHVLLVIDAAYAEYVTAQDYDAGLALAGSSDNVVVTRTFSKIYGLAGLRLGWGYGPAPVIDALNRIRSPFNVNSPASAAGIAALADRAHLQAAIDHNSRWLPWLAKEIGALGLETLPSVANFLAIRFPQQRGLTAQDADRFLTGQGLILRAVAAYGMPQFLRLSVGAEEANHRVVAALSDFMQELRAHG